MSVNFILGLIVQRLFLKIYALKEMGCFKSQEAKNNKETVQQSTAKPSKIPPVNSCKKTDQIQSQQQVPNLNIVNQDMLHQKPDKCLNNNQKAPNRGKFNPVSNPNVAN